MTEATSECPEQERRPDAGCQQQKGTLQQRRQDLGRRVETGSLEWEALCSGKNLKQKKTARERTQEPLSEAGQKRIRTLLDVDFFG